MFIGIFIFFMLFNEFQCSRNLPSPHWSNHEEALDVLRSTFDPDVAEVQELYIGRYSRFFEDWIIFVRRVSNDIPPVFWFNKRKAITEFNRILPKNSRVRHIAMIQNSYSWLWAIHVILK